MRNLILVAIILLVSTCTYSQEPFITGVLNSTETDKSFGKGHDAIKESILDNIANLNLYEYAHSLQELYELMHSNNQVISKWNNYIDTLLNEVKKEKEDTLSLFYVSDYKGIIALQASFFINSLEENTELKKKYPGGYEELKKSTSKLLGKGYTFEEIQDLLVMFPRNSTVGTVNFWLFLQVYGCPVIELAIKKEGIERIKMLMKNLDITSTYKTPLYLQLRKYKSLKKNIEQCLMDYNIELKGTTLIMDKNRNYYKESLKEGFDMDKMKEF